MHDLLEDFGKYTVHRESSNVGKRSRLWKFEDIKEVLENNKGSEAIQAIVMKDRERKPQIKVHPDAFSKMSNIRLMFIYLRNAYHPLILQRGSRLSGALKVIWWNSFPLKALPFETPLDKLVHIQMRFCKIKKLGNGRQSMRMLKYINLNYCGDLIETPDFSGVPHLEYLLLRGCTSLTKVHPSLGRLTMLVEVDFGGCLNLQILPTRWETNSLRKLDLGLGRKLAVLPEFGDGMKNLSYLDVSSLPHRKEHIHLIGRSCLKLSNLNYLKELKTDIVYQIRNLKITSLTELYLRWCDLNDGSIPNEFVSLPSLTALDLSGNDFVNLPTGCFSSLSRLLFLSLDNCRRLKSLPRLPPRLVQLNAAGCESMEALSSDGDRLWDLVASLDHELRTQTKYVISIDDDDDGPLWVGNDIKNIQERWGVRLRDFRAIIPGSRIPSWFPNKKYYPRHKERRGEQRYVIKVKIPQDLRDSVWSGIVVCLHMSPSGYARLKGIGWSGKGADNDGYMYKQWYEGIWVVSERLCMMVLELNEKTCWQHLRGPYNNNTLHVNLYVYHDSDSGDGGIMGCGWRVICKEEIQQERCNDYHRSGDLKQLTTQSEVDDVITVPARLLHRF